VIEFVENEILQRRRLADLVQRGERLRAVIQAVMCHLKRR
jgi:hypothetical protein